jgi:hypothetical protein
LFLEILDVFEFLHVFEIQSPAYLSSNELGGGSQGHAIEWIEKKRVELTMLAI